MRERVEPGATVDGYLIGECIHAGGNGAIFRGTAPADRDPGFAIVIKAPLLGRGESSIGIVSFEIEQLILPTLAGAHVPRFVHAGDITTTPYIVMEWIAGRSLSDVCKLAPLPADEVAAVGAALADAVQSVHAQHVIHLDIKPDNFILRANGDAVLLDFGFAHHERYPDLLAEEQQFAAGSSPYVSPEQLQDDRSDPRSDLFALGVVLYQLATGGFPFGEPLTLTGMRDRLWRAPRPPRAVNRQVPTWLQEVILHCLEPDANARYSSAAQIAFDLRHPEQIEPTARGERTQGQGFIAQLVRWWRMRYGTRLSRQRAPAAASQPSVVMVAVDTEHPDDERHSPLRFATAKILSLDPSYRLMCVSVIRSAPVGEGTQEAETTTGRHVEHKARLRHWVASLNLPPSRISLHVVEAVNAADTLLDLARTNHVGLIVLGAPGPSRTRIGWWRSAASTVTANAPCSVHVVRVPERSDANLSAP